MIKSVKIKSRYKYTKYFTLLKKHYVNILVCKRQKKKKYNKIGTQKIFMQNNLLFSLKNFILLLILNS